MVLADSCRGFNLATTSSSVSYHECVPNRACQEGRKSWLSLIGFRKSICACPCIIVPMVRSRPQAPDGNQPILTKWCKYRPDFTPFGHFDTFCLKIAPILHRFSAITHTFCFFLNDRRFILQDKPIFAYVCLSTSAPSGLPLEPNVLQKTAWIRKSLFCFSGKNSKPPPARVMEVPGMTDGSLLELILLWS